MTMIPNTRNIYAMPFFKGGEKSINPYYEGFLNDEGRKYVDGFDYCVRESVEKFFDNLDIYAEVLNFEGLSIDDIDMTVINSNETLSDEKLEELNSSTRIIKTIKDSLLGYIESERDSIIVSLIETMSESEYATRKKEVLKERGIEDEN